MRKKKNNLSFFKTVFLVLCFVATTCQQRTLYQSACDIKKLKKKNLKSLSETIIIFENYRSLISWPKSMTLH